MPILLFLSISSSLFPLILGYRNRWTWLWIYPLVGFVFDVSISYFKRVEGVYAEWPINLFLMVEAVFLMWIFSKELFASYLANLRWTLFLIIWAFLITSFYENPLEFHFKGAVSLYFIYILLSLYGLYYLIRRPSELYLEKSWFFWFTAGILIYASGSVLLFLFRDYLIEFAPEFFNLIWNSVFQLLNITKNVMIGLALYHIKPSKIESV